jgi:DNA-binding response OmpR family regulator
MNRKRRLRQAGRGSGPPIMLVYTRNLESKKSLQMNQVSRIALAKPQSPPRIILCVFAPLREIKRIFTSLVSLRLDLARCYNGFPQ